MTPVGLLMAWGLRFFNRSLTLARFFLLTLVDIRSIP